MLCYLARYLVMLSSPLFGYVIEPVNILCYLARYLLMLSSPLFAYVISFQPVPLDWCNKGRGICYPVCEMMHIKEPLLLIGFPFSLSEWSFTIWSARLIIDLSSFMIWLRRVTYDCYLARDLVVLHAPVLVTPVCDSHVVESV